ncbi:SHOCT domain-containing protein [Blastococcus sp. SYSU D00695]
MPLLRGMARTAVIAGTATAVSNRVSRRQGNRWAHQEAQQQAQYAEPAPARTDTNTKLAQLRELGQLKDSGVLDEAEFELQKNQILNS